MKKKFIALILILTIFPLTLTSCFVNTYNAKFDSKVQSYLDLDYVESLEIFGTTAKNGKIYIIDNESTFKKALPEYDSSVDFDKQISILHIYKAGNTSQYYIHSIKLDEGVLKVGLNDDKIIELGMGSAIPPYTRCFLLTIDKISFDSVEFVDVRWGAHPR